MNKKIVIALTGHRPKDLWGYDLNNQNYIRMKILLEKMIEEALTKNEIVECHSGMALGADTIWAQAIINMKEKYADRVLFVAEIPHQEQDNKWSERDKIVYRELLTHADSSVIYSEHYTNYCLLQRNLGMIKSCNLLLAVWNEGSLERGGTAHAIKNGVKENKNILILPTSFKAPYIYNRKKVELDGI